MCRGLLPPGPLEEPISLRALRVPSPARTFAPWPLSPSHSLHTLWLERGRALSSALGDSQGPRTSQRDHLRQTPTIQQTRLLPQHRGTSGPGTERTWGSGSSHGLPSPSADPTPSPDPTVARLARLAPEMPWAPGLHTGHPCQEDRGPEASLLATAQQSPCPWGTCFPALNPGSCSGH